MYNLLERFKLCLEALLVVLRSASRHGRFWPYNITSRAFQGANRVVSRISLLQKQYSDDFTERKFRPKVEWLG